MDIVTDRVTQGDAQAVLNAFGGGGRVILNHERADLGAPADSEIQASIRPFSGTIFDGRHYCAEDWHVILLAEIFYGDKSITLQEARADLDQTTLEFVLDGNVLETERTAIKRFLDIEAFGFEEAYYFQEGVVLAPDELSVGSHTLSLTESGSFGTSTDEITFFIDASGTGACL
jgi:hypothetical protein